MQPDETQPLLDFHLEPSDRCRLHIFAAPNALGVYFSDMELVAQGLCGLAFWAGQLQGENEKLRQEALAAPRSDAGPMGGAAQALLASELQEATRALREARRDRAEADAELRVEQEETAELRRRLRAQGEPSEELQVARQKAASLHAQVQELVERNTALEQEVCDLKCEKDALLHEGMKLAKRLQDAVEAPPTPTLVERLTHSAEAQDDVLREAERWRLAAEALQRNLQAREEEWARRGMELLRHQALVESFARELGEAMLKRALEVRT